MSDSPFRLTSEYAPTGDQPGAIKELVAGIHEGRPAQVLLGATGTGKTFTMANVIQQIGRPTLLVSHNIDLAPRVADLESGDEILFRGQYEWNERGGVLHWTHRDPDGRRPGGWLQHEGSTYR